jgi:hypothetical protein
MRIDGSEIADHWLDQAPQPHIRTGPALVISLKVARGVIRDLMNNSHCFQILISQKGMEYTHATSLWVVVDQEYTHLR